MKSLLALLGLTLLASTTVSAQTKNFNGPSLSVHAISGRSAFSGSTAEDGQTDTSAQLQAHYSHALNTTYTVGVGMSLGLDPMKAGSTGRNQFKLLDAGSPFVTLGYAWGRNNLLYGKLVYARAEASHSIPSASYTVAGVGYGVGIQRLVTGKNLFVQAELLQTNYGTWNESATDSWSFRATAARLGVGYKF